MNKPKIKDFTHAGWYAALDQIKSSVHDNESWILHSKAQDIFDTIEFQLLDRRANLSYDIGCRESADGVKHTIWFIESHFVMEPPQ